MELEAITWKRVNHGNIEVPLIDYLENLIEIEYEKGNKLKICVGTDSQKKGKGYQFATAIIVEVKAPMGIVLNKMTYVGRGGKVISGVFFERQRIGIRERMLKEVQMSINVGYYLLPLMELYDVDMEIHADVNPNPMAGSNIALKEAVGYITGMGFTCRVKPDAYAASSGADKLCH
jgi:predicted RNase H-related nuclease YkuK (DUF458 family)